MPDGSIKHVRVVGHAEGDESSELEFVGAVMDVTAAKEAEERIRQDERELRITIETIPAFVVSAEADGSLNFVSPSLLDYLGLSREEWLASGWMNRAHPEDVDRVVNKWQMALAVGERFEEEYRLRRADGQYRWFLVRSVPLRDDRGSIVKWYATALDIEDRKQAEESLRRSEAYLAEAQRLTHTGSWALNVATGEPIYSSEEHSRLYGFRPASGPSMQAFQLRIHPEDRDRSREAFDRAVGERTDYEMDYRVVLPDGTIKFIHAIGHPVFNAAGDLVEYIGTSMDVTERRQAEDAVRKAQAELAHIARVSTMGEMAASIAHEVDQPLSGVVINANACLRFLTGAAPNLDEVRDGLQAIARDGRRASDVIARIRALARRTATEKEPLDIDEVIREVVALAEGEAATHTRDSPDRARRGSPACARRPGAAAAGGAQPAPERTGRHARGRGPPARAGHQHATGGERSRPCRGAGLGIRHRPAARVPDFRGVLHHQGRWSGDGPLDQPFHRRAARRATLGRAE